MVPDFDDDGNLPPGIHFTTWQDFCQRFGTNAHRKRLMAGLKDALISLKNAGCKVVYIGGSFITSKETPNDFDACWEVQGVDPLLIDPILLKFDDKRLAQKTKYLGELFPDKTIEVSSGKNFLEFFSTDLDGKPKGIVALNLQGELK